MVPGGMVTAATDPVEIARDMGPIMEALGTESLPIQIPTGWSGWQGGLHYIYNPIWVDEIAGIFPDVPIVLTKMGRGFRSCFDACMVIAMRNANVYFDMTESPSEHVREALARIGPSRIMFGTDLSAISVNYAYEHGFAFLNGTEPDAEELALPEPVPSPGPFESKVRPSVDALVAAVLRAASFFTASVLLLMSLALRSSTSTVRMLQSLASRTEALEGRLAEVAAEAVRSASTDSNRRSFEPDE